MVGVRGVLGELWLEELGEELEEELEELEEARKGETRSVRRRRRI